MDVTRMVFYGLWLLLQVFLMNTRPLVYAVDSASLKESAATPAYTNNQSTVIHHSKVTQSQGTSTRERILYFYGGTEEDYDDFDEETTVSPHSPVPLEPCPYDRCEHLSPTCDEIQDKATGNCLCPGIDGPNVKPDPPKLRQVVPGDQGVTVTWCSPSSTVNSYRVLYQGLDNEVEKVLLVNGSYRTYSIVNLQPATQYIVCVVAINNAGESVVEIDEAEEGTEGSINSPCRIFHTTASKKSHMYIGIGVGLGAFVIVSAALAIILCTRRKRKNKMDAEEKEMEISNHAYRAGTTY